MAMDARSDHHHDEIEGSWSGYVMGLVLLVLFGLGALTYFGILVPANIFGILAVVAVLAVLAMAFFDRASGRAAAVFSVAVAVLVAGVFYLGHPVLAKGQYQAVFLTNGQVYFGHLQNPESRNPVLTDIYYLQSSQAPQPEQDQNQQQPQLSLVKLGNELHGPEDSMVLNRDQVLFWENLKDSGKVVQAIKENKKQE